MRNLLIAAVLFAAGFGLWRYTATQSAQPPAPAHAAANGEITTQQLLELNKTNPQAFNAYVQAHINDVPPSASENRETKTAHQPMSFDEFIKAGKTDPQAVAAFIESYTEQPERTEMDKLLNWLAHGKYE